VTVLAALPVLVVVFAIAAIPLTGTATTRIRRVLAGVLVWRRMSACRTQASAHRTLLSALRTTRITSLPSAAVWAHRSAPTRSLIASHESTASPDRHTRAPPLVPDLRAAPCPRQATEPTKNQQPPLHQSQRPATDQPNRRQDSTSPGTSPFVAISRLFRRYAATAGTMRSTSSRTTRQH
jgi:hypothetical protein